MTPSFSCPSCGVRFRAEERFVGRRVRCPNAECGRSIVLTVLSSGGDVSAPRSSGSSVASNSGRGRKPSASVGSGRRQNAAATRRHSRYESGERSSLMLLFTGFAVTSLLGGLALVGYWHATSPGDETPAQSERNANDSGAVAADRIVGGHASDHSGNGIERLAGTVVSGEPILTSAVSGEVLRRNAERQKSLDDVVVPFLKKHCLDCHNAEESEGGISVHDLERVDQLLAGRKKWERIYRMINAGAMPPGSYDPQPEMEDREHVARLLYDELFNFDCGQIRHAGRSTLHRLNRAEYNNTIRDLFGISLRPADEFPQDDVGEGFDNIGDVLSVPPLLMEKYLDAAEKVAAAVIDTRDFSKGMKQAFPADQFASSLNGNVNGEGFYTLATNGNVSVRHDAVAAGKYTVRIEAKQSRGGDENAKMALRVDDQVVHEFEVEEYRRGAWFEHVVELAPGTHTISAAFLNDFWDPKAPERRRDRNLYVRVIEIEGPEGGTVPQWHETHQRFVKAIPSETLSLSDAAAQVLRPILYRGFRRPVSDDEVARFASLVERTVMDQEETYEYGLFVAIQAMLVSPDFLFRKEADPEGDAKERSLNDYEVASRLSYFLWSSMPDDELLQLAENRRLLEPEMLRRQVERMLRDEKSLALGQNFASQWLNLRNLADVRPNPDLFPEFDESLRAAMAEETSLLFNTVVREDRSIDEFLSADYTFVNERLARHYGISGISGDEFIRVSLTGMNRVGVLTHASVLTLTSNPGRTSPVKRGKWILENILGDAPPPAPPGVPALEEAAKDVSNLSLRERLEIHRQDPGCASCHKTMDPLGMGLENFDAVGRWREREGEIPVDASGDLPSGESFSGPVELVSIIRSRQEKFARTVAERLMVYALGRGLEYYDKCAVDRTLELMKQRGNRFSSLVEGIVTSDPFLKRSRSREVEGVH